jgi:hypothetical protein
LTGTIGVLSFKAFVSKDRRPRQSKRSKQLWAILGHQCPDKVLKRSVMGRALASRQPMHQRQPLRTKGLIIRSGVSLPPAGGPGRTKHCFAEGAQALLRSQQRYGYSLMELLCVLDSGLGQLPPIANQHLLEASDSDLVFSKSRVQQWKELRTSLRNRIARDPVASCWLQSRWRAAETTARKALAAAVEAFHWFDDMRHDLSLDTVCIATDRPRFWVQEPDETTLGDLLDGAHMLVHRIGEMVGGLFGCLFTYDDGRWYEQCPVSLMHVPLGNSPGISMLYGCSVCDGDPSRCTHDFGLLYERIAETIDGVCSVCEEKECEHAIGATYPVKAYPRRRSLEVHEISLVPRPRDPLARITARTVDDRDLRAILGFAPTPHVPVMCDTCMYVCEGFRTAPAFVE